MDKLTNIKGKLLEGCVWDEREQKLYFVDIECRKIYCMYPEKNVLRELSMEGYVGCVVLEEDGKLIAALPDGLYRVDFETGEKRKIMDSQMPAGLRYNDGKCGPDGRLWVGSMAVCQTENAEGAGALFCVERERIRKVYPGFTIPNGLAWSREEGYFYHIDTPTGKVDRYRMTEEGIEDRRTAVDLRTEDGNPDGMCMDSRGYLWIAMWGGGKVICADPGTGKVLEELMVGDRYVSCCTFGGAQMDELFITTARDEDGNGGEVYVQKMQVQGMAPDRYGR